jgi:hypothetical protein
LQFDPVTFRETVASRIVRMHENLWRRATVAKLLNVALTSLKKWILPNAIKGAIRVLLAGRRPLSKIRQWIETEVLED